MPNNTTRKNKILRNMRNKFPGARNLYAKNRKNTYKNKNNNLTNNNLNAYVVNTSGNQWKLRSGNNNTAVPYNLHPSQYRSERNRNLSIKPSGYTNKQWLKFLEDN